MMTTESQTWIGLRECGCLVMAVVDTPERRRDVAKEVARAIREGLNVQKVSSQSVREMAWKPDSLEVLQICEQHKSVKP